MNSGRRSRLRFSLRTMFVIVTLFGVALGWLGVQVKWIRDRHAFLAEDGHIDYSRWDRLSIPRIPEPIAPGGLWLLGETGKLSIGFSGLSEKEEIEPSSIERARRLFPEARIYGAGKYWPE